MTETLLAALKTVHVIAAILFVGNVVVTGVWTAVYFRARATHDFRVAARAIVLTDWIFTFGGGAVLVLSGIGLAQGRGFPIWGTPWIRHALLALGLSTVVWLVVLVPAQRVMLRASPDDGAALTRAYHRWNVTGWAATIPLVYAVWCMVAKPGS
jgi:uncharacterized membrane protein